MAADNFFSRWSQRKSQADHAEAEQPLPREGEDGDTPSGAEPAPTPEESLPPPTIDDVANLTHDSDFSRFVHRDVDEAVKRSAFKKLFTNPHFNVMDGLDIYIDDYNKFTPMTPALLASLNHAKDLLNPPGLKKPVPAESDDHKSTPEAMEMPSSQNDAAAATEQSVTEHQAEPESAEAEEAEATNNNTKMNADAAEQFASQQAAERLPDDHDKEKTSPQGDS